MRVPEYSDKLSRLVPPDFSLIEGYRDLASFDARMWVLHFLIRSYWKCQQGCEEFKADVGEPPRGTMTIDGLKGYMEDHNTTDWPWDLVCEIEGRLAPRRLAFGAVRSVRVHDIMHILRISDAGGYISLARDLHWKDFFFPESTETKEIHAKPLVRQAKLGASCRVKVPVGEGS